MLGVSHGGYGRRGPPKVSLWCYLARQPHNTQSYTTSSDFSLTTLRVSNTYRGGSAERREIVFCR